MTGTPRCRSPPRPWPRRCPGIRPTRWPRHCWSGSRWHWSTLHCPRTLTASWLPISPPCWLHCGRVPDRPERCWSIDPVARLRAHAVCHLPPPEVRAVVDRAACVVQSAVACDETRGASRAGPWCIGIVRALAPAFCATRFPPVQPTRARGPLSNLRMGPLRPGLSRCAWPALALAQAAREARRSRTTPHDHCRSERSRGGCGSLRCRHLHAQRRVAPRAGLCPVQHLTARYMVACVKGR